MFFRCRRDTDAVWEGGVVLIDTEKVYCEDPTVVTMNFMMVSEAKQGGAVSLTALPLRLQSLSLRKLLRKIGGAGRYHQRSDRSVPAGGDSRCTPEIQRTHRISADVW